MKSVKNILGYIREQFQEGVRPVLLLTDLWSIIAKPMQTMHCIGQLIIELLLLQLLFVQCVIWYL